MKLVWSPLALERVNEIADYIARDRPVAAEQWVEEILAAVERLEQFPLTGREVPETRRADLREVLHGSYRTSSGTPAGAKADERQRLEPTGALENDRRPWVACSSSLTG